MVTHSQIGNGKLINNTDHKVLELYEKIIKKQEAEIDYLKGIVNIFKQ